MRRFGRKTWLLLGVFLVIGAVIFAFALRASMESKLIRSLHGRAAGLGFDTSIGDLSLSWSGDVTIDDLELRGPDAVPNRMSFPFLRVSLGNFGIFERRVSIRQILLRNPVWEIPDIQELRDVVRSYRSGDEKKADGPSQKRRYMRFGGFKLDLRRRPDLVLENMSLVVPTGTLSACNGRVKDQSRVTDAWWPKITLACDYEYAHPRLGGVGEVELVASWNSAEEGWDVHFKMDPAIEVELDGRTVSVAGLHRKPNGQVEVVDAMVRNPGLSMRAARVHVRTKEDTSVRTIIEDVRAGRSIREVLSKYFEVVTLRDVAVSGPADGGLTAPVRRTLEELLPAMLRNFPVADPDDEESNVVVRSGRNTAIHNVVISKMGDLSSRFQHLLRLPHKIIGAMDVPCIEVQNAHILDGPVTQEAPLVLSQIDIKICREHLASGVQKVVLDLRSKSATSDQATEKLIVTATNHPTDPMIEGKLEVHTLNLSNYSAFMPTWIVLGPNASLEKVNVDGLVSSTDDFARVEGSMTILDTSLNVPAVSEKPVYFEELGLRGVMDYARTEGRLIIQDGVLDLGVEPVSWSLKVSDVPKSPQVQLNLGMNMVSAQDFFLSIPDALVSTLRPNRRGPSAEFAGKVGGDVELQFRTKDLRKLKLDFRPRSDGFQVESLGPRVRLDILDRPLLHEFKVRRKVKGNSRKETLKTVQLELGPTNPYFVPYDDIPPLLIAAITTTEDARYFKHDGFYGRAIRRSLIRNLQKGRFVRGASTITQQTVKNLFLSHEKTISRKLQEAIITYELNRRVPKERVLEIYFNIIEWGPDVYGLGHAARHYFDKYPEELNLADILFLVSIVPSPRSSRWKDTKREGQITERWRNRLERYARRMLERKKITRAQFQQASPFRPRFDGGDIIDTLPPPVPLGP
ncbi:MAG: hypothetical protein CMH54_05270 [Myxococcales bacterium]|nr:hypothetical protein [Myxococcales bacterium]